MRTAREIALDARVVLVVAVLLVVLGGLAPVRAANDVTFRADVNAQKVGVEDTFALTATIEGSSFDLKENIAPPSLKNLRIVGGPSVSTQMNIVNGSMSQARSYTWRLQAIAPGPAEIGPITAALDVGNRTTSPISIEVVEGSVLPRRQRSQDPFERFFGGPDIDSMMNQRRRQSSENARVFIEAEPTRTRLLVGEPLVLSYALYTQANVGGLDFEQAPAFPGFWAKDFEREKEPQPERVVKDGERFTRFVVYKKLLFPTKSGTLTIPAADFKVQLAGFFDEPVVRRHTKPIDVTVDAPPAPAGFSGAVGRFRATTTIDRTSLAIGDAATVRFRVDGTGNLEWVDRAPALAIPGAKIYPPQVKSELKPSPDGLVGSKTWEFVVVPETAGEFEVPALGFDYVDATSKKFTHAETATLPFHVGTAIVGGATDRPAATAPPATPGTGGGDLRLRAELDQGRGGSGPGARGILVTLVVVLLAHGTLLLVPRLGNVRGASASGGPRSSNARAALADLRRATKGDSTKESAAALIEKALFDVFGDLDARAAEVVDPLERDARELLRDVRFIRYAPQLGEYAEKIHEVAERAAALIRRRS